MSSQKRKFDYQMFLDRIFGLRAWGLILYGALPANLALLGAIEIKISPANEQLPFLLIPATILPILLIFILIRDRHREWYLTTDSLNLRSVIVSITILFVAMLICGISGIIHNTYIIGLPDSWNLNEWTAIAESFLLAVASLVLSSTLFMTALKRGVDLPGLPSSDFVELITKLRKNMRKMKGSKIWKEYIPLDDNEFIKLIEDIKIDIESANTYTGNNLSKRELRAIYDDFENLLSVIHNINKTVPVLKQKEWKKYFEKSSDDGNVRRDENKFNSINKLKDLNLGD